jgi:hypothetical protein
MLSEADAIIDVNFMLYQRLSTAALGQECHYSPAGRLARKPTAAARNISAAGAAPFG